MNSDQRVGGSFRDPSGFLFTRRNVIYRQVNKSYRQNYDLLQESGLYKELTDRGFLIPHTEVETDAPDPELAYKIIQPERLEFVSYPYEWCFSQLKDAALLTLDLQKRALTRGMWIKDASATNIQFHKGRPILIDSLSFEVYPEGQPWVAYRQFCQHFLAPLALMALKDVRLSQLLRIHIDGIDLGLTSKLLPRSTRFNLGLLTHIHLHAAAQKRYAGQSIHRRPGGGGVSKMAMLGLLDHLERTVQKLKWTPAGTAWGDYYRETNYSQAAQKHKIDLVRTFIKQAEPKSLWDLGANTGIYSRLASEQGIFTLATDYDPAAVEISYLRTRNEREPNLLPLVIDLGNPSAAIGWANQERKSLTERGPADAIMALALIHHLAIGNNVPLRRIAEFLSLLGSWLIIEFVPKADSQVQRLLVSRKDIFDKYDRDGFVDAFAPHYQIIREEPISDSQRTLFLMKSK
ncbi:MAG: class I SAM-dependent methyltransferase [Anaerolineales bacterium]